MSLAEMSTNAIDNMYIGVQRTPIDLPISFTYDILDAMGKKWEVKPFIDPMDIFHRTHSREEIDGIIDKWISFIDMAKQGKENVDHLFSECVYTFAPDKSNSYSKFCNFAPKGINVEDSMRIFHNAFAKLLSPEALEKLHLENPPTEPTDVERKLVTNFVKSMFFG